MESSFTDPTGFELEMKHPSREIEFVSRVKTAPKDQRLQTHRI